MTQRITVLLDFHGHGKAVVNVNDDESWFVVEDPKQSLGEGGGGKWGRSAGGTVLARNNDGLVALLNFRFVSAKVGDRAEANNYRLSYVGEWRCTSRS